MLPGIIGSIQANEALKLLLGAGEPLLGRLLLFDALGMRFRELALRRDARCPLCGDQPTQHELVEYDDACAPPAADPPAGGRESAFEIAATEVARRRAAGERFTLLDVRLEHELRLARLPDTLWIPLHELPQRLGEVPRDRPVFALCHSGNPLGRGDDTVARAGFRRGPQPRRRYRRLEPRGRSGGAALLRLTRRELSPTLVVSSRGGGDFRNRT